MAGLPEAVIERAQEISDVLSGRPDLEDQVPLKKKLAKTISPERQLNLLGL